jgi:hypothetical protein
MSKGNSHAKNWRNLSGLRNRGLRASYEYLGEKGLCEGVFDLCNSAQLLCDSARVHKGQCD